MSKRREATPPLASVKAIFFKRSGIRAGGWLPSRFVGPLPWISSAAGDFAVPAETGTLRVPGRNMRPDIDLDGPTMKNAAWFLRRASLLPICPFGK